MLSVTGPGRGADLPIARPVVKAVVCQSQWIARSRVSLVGRVVRGIVLGTENSAAVWGYCGMHGCRHMSVGPDVAGGRLYIKGILGL
ncbi:hypothetical protein QF015_000742 [Paenarthrobacter sp. TE4293]